MINKCVPKTRIGKPVCKVSKCRVTQLTERKKMIEKSKIYSYDRGYSFSSNREENRLMWSAEIQFVYNL